MAVLGHFYYIYHMDYTELHTQIENIKQWCIKHRIGIITASQPHRGGTGLSPEELAELAKRPIIIDYIGCIRSSI